MHWYKLVVVMDVSSPDLNVVGIPDSMYLVDPFDLEISRHISECSPDLKPKIDLPSLPHSDVHVSFSESISDVLTNPSGEAPDPMTDDANVLALYSNEHVDDFGSSGPNFVSVPTVEIGVNVVDVFEDLGPAFGSIVSSVGDDAFRSAPGLDLNEVFHEFSDTHFIPGRGSPREVGKSYEDVADPVVNHNDDFSEELIQHFMLNFADLEISSEVEESLRDNDNACDVQYNVDSRKRVATKE